MVSRKNSALRVSLLFYSDISYYSNKTRLDTVPKMYLESQHPFAHFIHLLKQYHFSLKILPKQKQINIFAVIIETFVKGKYTKQQ